MNKKMIALLLITVVAMMTIACSTKIPPRVYEADGINSSPSHEYFSSNQFITKHLDLGNGERYELVFGIVEAKPDHLAHEVCFHRTKIMEGESVEAAQKRVCDVYEIMKDKLTKTVTLPEEQGGEPWIDTQNQTVSCLVYRKFFHNH